MAFPSGERRRNPYFDLIVRFNDCTKRGKKHMWEYIGEAAKGCVCCTRTRKVRVLPKEDEDA